MLAIISTLSHCSSQVSGIFQPRRREIMRNSKAHNFHPLPVRTSQRVSAFPRYRTPLTLGQLLGGVQLSSVPHFEYPITTPTSTVFRLYCARRMGLFPELELIFPLPPHTGQWRDRLDTVVVLFPLFLPECNSYTSVVCRYRLLLSGCFVLFPWSST